MRTTQNLLILLSFLFSTAFCLQDYHHYNDFYKPVVYSPDGIKQFLIRTYNQPIYGKDFLPNNFCHLIQFLQHGKQIGQTKSYARSVIRLFNNKLKSSSYINAYAFSQLLKELPHLLKDYFIIYKSNELLDSLKDSIYETLFGSFKNNFSSFKKSPTTFLENLSQEVLDIVGEGQHVRGHVDVQDEGLLRNRGSGHQHQSSEGERGELHNLHSSGFQNL